MDTKKQKTFKPDKKKTYTEEEIKAMFPELNLKVFHKEKGQITYKVCGSIDVHKRVLVACVCITDPITFLPSYYVYKCCPNNNQLVKMEKWMKSLEADHVVMESTGKYSLPIYRHLLSHGFIPVITNPKYVNQIKGQKTDERDAIHMANVFRMGMVTPSIIPTEELQDIRDLSRFRKRLTEDQTRERNRFQNALETCGIRLGNVLDDVFGKTGLAIAKYLITTPEEQVTDPAILSLIDPRCKSTKEEILDSVKGYKISPARRTLMETILGVLDDLDRRIGEVKAALDEATSIYVEDVTNLETVPGVGHVSAISILAEVGNDMSLWSGVDQFISWCGLCPANNASANRKKSTRIGKGGYYLKPIMVECALSAIGCKDSYYRNKYNRIAKRRGKNKAIIAVARMMMRSIYFILRDKTCWLPKDKDSTEKSSSVAKTDTHNEELQKAYEILKHNGVDEKTLKIVMEQCGTVQSAS